MRNQPITSALNGAMTGALGGLTLVLGVGVPVAGVGPATTVGVWEAAGFVAAAVDGPAAKAKIIWAIKAIKTTVVAKSSGLSERAGVTRYQWPSHIAVSTPPSAKEAAKKPTTVKMPPTFAAATGRKIIAITKSVTRPAA